MESNCHNVDCRRPKIIIGALSGWQYGDRRQRCRTSWMADAASIPNVEPYFLIGAGEQVTDPTELDDLLLLPCPNDYPSLPQRTRWFCQWALQRDHWDYLFKCDDDTYVCIDRLASFDLEGRDYIGAEWQPGVGYGSGGAGYFLSRRAATIVAEKLSRETGAEDLLVGKILRSAGIEFHNDNRFWAYGNADRRPKRDNDIITTHGIGADIFLQSHRETGGGWRFRIVMPTCNAYAADVVPVTLRLLRNFWPTHPSVDVLHYEAIPPEFNRTTGLHMGQQAATTWTKTLAEYLEHYNHNQLVMLMLDDYGLCAPVKSEAIETAQRQMLSDPKIGNVHLTWQPARPKTSDGPFLRLPRWMYSINTQAALWRHDLLLETAQRHSTATIVDFELQGSAWFNQQRFGQYAHCQASMPEPGNPSGFVDETDKSDWLLPYNNLMRRGSFDSRHASFLEQHEIQRCGRMV